MGAADERSRLFVAFEESLGCDTDIEFAVAFGSQVTDDPHPSSDLDIAVKFADDLSARERFRKRCFLSGDLQREGDPFVDVSDFETLPLEVAHDASTGELLCGDEQAFHQFKAAIETEFEERLDEIRRHRQDVIDRIAEDGLRGR